MSPGLRFALTLGLLVLGLWFYDSTRPVRQPPGILAPDAPRVQPVGEAMTLVEHGTYRLQPLARFDATARVLSIERYSRDRAGALAPFDIVLGWGPLSDSVTLNAVDIAQTERRVLYQSYDPKLPDAQMASYLLNLHVIPADATLQAKLAELRRGILVRVEGLLVEATADKDWRWKGEPREIPPSTPGTLLWLQTLEVVQAQPPQPK
jgi:hypothetical protein